MIIYEEYSCNINTEKMKKNIIIRLGPLIGTCM